MYDETVVHTHIWSDHPLEYIQGKNRSYLTEIRLLLLHWLGHKASLRARRLSKNPERLELTKQRKAKVL